MSERRRIRNDALTGLDAEIALRRSELAVLERARDTIARGDGCDGTDGPCAAIVHVALCRVCGYVARCCNAHGGKRAATTALRFHQHQLHGAGWAASAATEDTGGVLRGSTPVSVGELSAPSASDDVRGTAAAQPADPVSTSESRTASVGERGRDVDR